MEELFKWSVITALVVSVVAFAMNFMTKSLGIRILVAIVLTIASVVWFMRKYGVPFGRFHSGGIIGLAAMAGLAVVMTKDILEYVLTLLLFAIAYGIGGLAGKFAMQGEEMPSRKKRKEEEEEPEEIEENEVSGE
jgi:hypothetical protein